MEGFEETRIYSVKNTVSPMWMNEHNLQLCIDKNCPNGGAEVVGDLTSEYSLLDQKVQKLKRLILLTDDVVSGVTVGTTQLSQWTEFLRMFPDEENKINI